MAPIQLLAWELPYAVGVALKKDKEKKKKKVLRKKENMCKKLSLHSRN